jgi:Domain of unknown function (DUF4205)
MRLHYLEEKNFTNTVQNCLALALAEIIMNASNGGKMCLVIPRNQTNSSSPALQPRNCSKIVVEGKGVENQCQIIYNLIKCYLQEFNIPLGDLTSSPTRKHGHSSSQGCQGVILLVYSVILSRGIN